MGRLRLRRRTTVAGTRRRAACSRLLFVNAGIIAVSCGVTGRAIAEKTVWGANRVPNNSFESEFENWNLRLGAQLDGPRKESTAVIDTAVAHSGVHSLKLSGGADTTYWQAVESEPIPITPGKSYKYSTWLKADDVHVEAGQYHNCNAYIQFRDNTGKIIPIGGAPLRRTYPTRGTLDWVEVFAIVVAPDDATQARFGLALTCSGTAWFDDMSLVESEGYALAKRESEGFDWYYTQGDVPTDAALEAEDAYLRRLEGVLGVEHEERIPYYKYKSIDQKTELTKRSSESHVEGNALHSVKWDEHQDVVHVLMKPLGASTLVLAEGIALYATAAVDGRDVHTDARQLVKDRAMIPISTFLDPGTLTIAPRHVKEAEFGSFVGYLVQRYGIEKFKELYPYPDAHEAAKLVAARFQEVYGKSLDDGEREWVVFLQSGKPKPAPATGDE